MYEYTLNKMLKKSSIGAGIKKEVSAHLFRHSLGTHLAMA
jgi:site-specific recombinase XerD